MLNARGRTSIRPFVEPVAASLNRAGVSPNSATVFGTAVSIALAITLIPAGQLWLAALLLAISTAFDLVDGTMARLRGGGTKFGATLDASCDRLTDAALFGSLVYWVVFSYGANRMLLILTLITMGASQAVSYVKARAEAGGLNIDGGLVERAERLSLTLIGMFLHGVGVPYALEVAMWLLCVGSLVTVIQRLLMAARHQSAQEFIAPPAGAQPPETTT